MTQLYLPLTFKNKTKRCHLQAMQWQTYAYFFLTDWQEKNDTQKVTVILTFDLLIKINMGQLLFTSNVSTKLHTKFIHSQVIDRTGILNSANVTLIVISLGVRFQGFYCKAKIKQNSLNWNSRSRSLSEGHNQLVYLKVLNELLLCPSMKTIHS
jgi:uncharacterized membrane protein